MSDLTSGIWVAVVVAVVGSAIGAILSARWRPRYWKKFNQQESESRQSWDKFRADGLKMTYPKTWKRGALLALGLFVSTLILGLMAIMIAPSPSSSSDVIALVIFFLFLSPVPLMLLMEVYGADCYVSATEIRKKSPWSRSVRASWNDVQFVRYERGNKSYFITTDKETIRVRAVLQGIGFFLQIMSEQVPQEKRSGGYHPANATLVQQGIVQDH